MTARRVAWVLVAVLAVYFVLLGQRALWLIGDGRLAFVLLGVGVLILPFVGAYTVWREVRFGFRMQEEGTRQDHLPKHGRGRGTYKGGGMHYDHKGKKIR